MYVAEVGEGRVGVVDGIALHGQTRSSRHAHRVLAADAGLPSAITGADIEAAGDLDFEAEG